jgi:hypothetical protein
MNKKPKAKIIAFSYLNVDNSNKKWEEIFPKSMKSNNKSSILPKFDFPV